MSEPRLETPLMKQYNAIKAKYPGALLLFRVGDFYETFGSDAIEASRVLDIVLTKRGSGSASEIELAGFPHHSLDVYMPKLVRAGHRVAICDQLEDPRFVKGIVKRGVTELITPGLALNDTILDSSRNNFLAAIYAEPAQTGLALLDLSTGEFYCTQGTPEYIQKLLQGFTPKEILYSKSQRAQFEPLFKPDYSVFALDEWVFSFDTSYERLTRQLKTTTLKGFGIEDYREGIIPAGAILHYLEATEHRNVAHISTISRIEEDQYVWLDKFTIRNLELIQPQHPGGVALTDILDHTKTAMGARLLRKWIILPLKSLHAINERLNVVQYLHANPEVTTLLGTYLTQISDLERLASKVAANRINPRELLQLKRSLQAIIPVRENLGTLPSVELNSLGNSLSPCDELIQRLTTSLKDDAPLSLSSGGVIADGIDAELDELRQIAFSGKDYLLQVQRREVERTGIASLKVAYNKVFGYYLEVSNANKDKVPTDWIRKQTLVNAERYITEELKIYEEKILTAEEKLAAIEFRLYNEIIAVVANSIGTIQENARTIARLDCLASFAHTSLVNRYCKPVMNDSLVIDIRNGRHPVIENQLPPTESYVPNDVYLNNDDQQIIIITGPNMAGKSALLRQTALITLMAQMGSFVPASEATLGIVDKVFTRVGASDNLSKGESTFMVEMTETASILNNLSSRSLILMDEIGRGTSTYDGVSIAWAIVEYLHNHKEFRPKTLFATHYHELNQLAEDHVRVRNFNVSVKETGDKILFMRKLKPGGSEHSFGIHVAQLAGMPTKILMRANEILHFLEKEKHRNEPELMRNVPVATPQMTLFEADPRSNELVRRLMDIDVNTISPVEALLKLNELKSLFKK